MTAEEKKLAVSMLPRKKKALYDKIMYSKKRKASQVNIVFFRKMSLSNKLFVVQQFKFLIFFFLLNFRFENLTINVKVTMKFNVVKRKTKCIKFDCLIFEFKILNYRSFIFSFLKLLAKWVLYDLDFSLEIFGLRNAFYYISK